MFIFQQNVHFIVHFGVKLLMHGTIILVPSFQFHYFMQRMCHLVTVDCGHVTIDYTPFLLKKESDILHNIPTKSHALLCSLCSGLIIKYVYGTYTGYI